MTKRLILGMAALGLTGTMAQATLLVDRGLPTANLNNAAGANRSNVAWTDGGYTAGNYWVEGDTFKNTSSQTWNISQITLWTIGRTATTSLWGGTAGSSTYGIVSASGTASPVTYAGGSTYQGTAGSYSDINQIDFTVNITLAPGEVYSFFLDGTGGTYTVPYASASNAALSGSPQQGSDGSLLEANVVGGNIVSVDAWDSNQPGVWDKSSDLNVQVFGSAVPDAANTALLTILGFAGLAFFSLKKNQLPATK